MKYENEIKVLTELKNYSESDSDVGMFAMIGPERAEALQKAIDLMESQPSWIPVTYHKITEEERKREGYPEEWDYIYDGELPKNGQETLITTCFGRVALDTYYNDDESYWESYSDFDDVKAWMPKPAPYKEEQV